MSGSLGSSPLEPDVVALNEVCVPRQSARWVQRAVEERLNVEYALAQQTKSNSLSAVEGEALPSPYPLRETGNLDYETRDMVALVARLGPETSDASLWPSDHAGVWADLQITGPSRQPAAPQE